VVDANPSMLHRSPTTKESLSWAIVVVAPMLVSPTVGRSLVRLRAEVCTTDAGIGDVPGKRFAVGLCGRNDYAFPEELSANVRKVGVSLAVWSM